MSEREEKLQAHTRAERQRQLGEHIENIIRGIPKAAKCVLLVLLGWPAPLLPIHLLSVNLITDTFPALSLGVDPGDPDVMDAPPKRATETLFRGSLGFLLGNGLLIGLLTLVAFLVGHFSQHDPVLEILLHLFDGVDLAFQP